MKQKSAPHVHPETPAMQAFKRKIEKISKDPSALARLKKIEAARVGLLKRLHQATAVGIHGHVMETFGIATSLLGCLSVVAATHMTSDYAIPAATTAILVAPSLLMMLAGVVIAGIGEFRRGEIAAPNDQGDDADSLSSIIREMERMEDGIIQEHAAEIVSEMEGSDTFEVRRYLPLVRECLLRQLQH